MSAALLVMSAAMSLMTKAPKEIPEDAGIMKSLEEKIAMARRQPADVYLGARYCI